MRSQSPAPRPARLTAGAAVAGLVMSVAAGGALVLLGAGPASAAPGEPSFDDVSIATTSNQLQVSGEIEALDDSSFQDLSVWWEDEQLCAVPGIPYYESTWQCGIALPTGEYGEYVLTVRAIGNEGEISGAESLTVTYGSDDDVTVDTFENYFYTESLDMTITGTGPALGSVTVEASRTGPPLDGIETSPPPEPTDYDLCTVNVGADGEWACDVEWPLHGYYELTATGADVTGAAVMPWGLVYVDVYPPLPTSHYSFGPGTATLGLTGLSGGVVGATFYSDIDAEDGFLGACPEEWYPFGSEPPNEGSEVSCEWNVEPGVYVWGQRQWVDGTSSASNYAGIRVPAVPQITLAVPGPNTVTVSGTVEIDDLDETVHEGAQVVVETDGGNELCTANTDLDTGAWSCSGALSSGPHSIRAYAVSLGFGPQFEFEQPFDEYLNGASPYSDTVNTVITAPVPPNVPTPPTVPAPPAVPTVPSVNAPPAPVPSPTPAMPAPLTEFTFEITDEDGNVITDQVRAGDRIWIKGSGLPSQVNISVELRSTPVDLGSQTVSSVGDFAIFTTIPRETPPGAHTVVVTASRADGESITVSSPVVVTSPDGVDEAPEGAVGGETVTTEVDDDSDTGVIVAEGGAGPDRGLTDPTPLGTQLLPIGALNITPGGVIMVAALAGLLALLIAIPAELLHSTLGANYTRAFKWMSPMMAAFKKLTEGMGRSSSRPQLVTTASVAITALLLGFADPGYGFNGASARMVLALFASLYLVNVFANTLVISLAARRFKVSGGLVPMPGALALVVISVLVTRLANIEPGLLFGLVIGVMFARELHDKVESQLTLVATGAMIGLGLLGWAGYTALTANAPEDPGFWYLLGTEITAGVTLEALVVPVVMLLPMQFLDGRSLFQWSKPAWFGAYAIAAAVFIFVALPTAAGLHDGDTPLTNGLIAVSVFTVLSVAVWAGFKYLPSKEREQVSVN